MIPLVFERIEIKDNSVFIETDVGNFEIWAHNDYGGRSFFVSPLNFDEKVSKCLGFTIVDYAQKCVEDIDYLKEEEEIVFPENEIPGEEMENYSFCLKMEKDDKIVNLYFDQSLD